MANEPLALAIEPEMPSEDDYRAFCAALSETARGRAFLAEYARRQRAADTDMLLGALERLEGLVRSQTPPPAPPVDDGVRQELLDLLDGIRDMQAEIDAGGLTMQVAKLASLIEVVQQQIEAIVAPAVRHAEAQAERAAVDDGESAALDGGTESQTDADAPAAPSAAMPEVSWFDGPQQGRAALAAASAQAPARSPSPALAIAAVIEAATAAAATAEPDTPAFTVFKAGTIPPPTPFAGEDFSRPSPPDDAVPPADPLAPITSLSEDERLALFT